MSRGRRRGSGRPAANLEGLGVPPGERIAPPSLEPPPLFPPLDKRPLDLLDNELYVELLGKKSSLRAAMQDSVFYLRKSQRDHELNIVRYSDKYKTKDERDIVELLASMSSWQQRLPNELHPRTKRIIKKAQRCKKPSNPTPTSQLETSKLNVDDTTSPSLGGTVTVSNIDLTSATGGYNEGEEEGGEEEEEEVYDEEEEEQGDYQLTYFDPGGDDAMIDDDDEEGGAGEYY